MNKTIRVGMALFLATMLLLKPITALADSGEDGNVVMVNGYQVELVFDVPVKVGENAFHIQITDEMGMPISGAEVEVEAMPNEGMDMHDEAPSMGVMTSDNSMEDMEMGTEAPSVGVMTSDQPVEDVHGEEVLTVTLEPAHETGEYVGELHFETSGAWMLSVHFTVNGESNQADFNIDIIRTLVVNYTVLAVFLGINGTLIASAAFLKKSKPVLVRK